MEPFWVTVPDIDTGKLVMNTLAAYDLFQYEHNVKPDYANAGGLRYRINPPNSTPAEDDWEEVDVENEEELDYVRCLIMESLEEKT